MKVTRHEDPRVHETIWEGLDETGLRIFVNPKRGYTKTFAVFGTRYGSIHTRFVDPVDPRGLATPEGIAHFLEHKLFESRAGDVLERFSRLGASANASTSFDQTNYVFAASGRVEEGLELLLDFVLHPEFTDEGIEKERRVIEQEIRMYDDDPEWRGYFQLLGGLFRNHPVRHPIGGTVGSIRRIRRRHLLRCFDAFYHPSNMVVAVSGNADARRVLRLVHERVRAGGWRRRPIPRLLPVAEPRRAVHARRTLRLDVARPQVLLGFKERELGGTGRAMLRRDLLTEMALQLLFGSASREFERLYEAGVVDDTFSYSYTGERDHGFSLLGGETEDPDAFAAAILASIDRVRRRGIDGEDVRRLRARFEGQFLQAFNSPETTAYALASSCLRGIPLFETIRILGAIRPAQVLDRLRAHFRRDALCVSRVLPRRRFTARSRTAGRRPGVHAARPSPTRRACEGIVDA